MSGIRQEFVDRVAAFMSRTGMSGRKFGLAVAYDTKFVWRLKNGHCHTLATLERAERFMAEYTDPAAVTPISGAQRHAA